MYVFYKQVMGDVLYTRIHIKDRPSTGERKVSGIK